MVDVVKVVGVEEGKSTKGLEDKYQVTLHSHNQLIQVNSGFFKCVDNCVNTLGRETAGSPPAV